MMKCRKKTDWIYTAEDCAKRIPDGAYFSSTEHLVLLTENRKALVLTRDSIVLTRSDGQKFLVTRDDFNREYEVVEGL